MDFCHIAPNSCLPMVQNYPVHLLLAHLIETDEEYRNFYADLKQKNPDVFYHMDCSTFELFKLGKPMYDSSKLIEMAKLVGADSVVLSDYPKEPWQKTIDAAKELIPQFKAAGLKTFFCPQSEFGDIDGLMNSFAWALNNPDIDFIGVSILACPIALGVNESAHGSEDTKQRDSAYKLQRYLSRYQVFQELKRRGLLTDKALGRLHCLGMTDGPNEIELLKEFHPYIFSWDSSSAIWHGINGISYDNSPTGLRNGKYEAEVQFDIAAPVLSRSEQAQANMEYIDRLCRGSL